MTDTPTTEQQPALFDLPPQQVIEIEDTLGKYSLAKIKDRNPRIYEACIRLLAAGAPVRLICKVLSMTPATVLAIRDAEPSAIITQRNLLGDIAGRVSLVGLELISERLEKLTPEDLAEVKDVKDLMIAIGIAIDKGLLVSGRPTSRVEVIQGEPDHEAFNRAVAGTDLDGERSGQKRRALPPDPQTGEPHA